MNKDTPQSNEQCEHNVSAKYCFRCKRPDLAGPVPQSNGMPHPFANPEGVYGSTSQSDPVSDFFNAPDEVKRPVYERALEKAQEEQSNIDWLRQLKAEERLSKDVSALYEIKHQEQ